MYSHRKREEEKKPSKSCVYIYCLAVGYTLSSYVHTFFFV